MATKEEKETVVEIEAKDIIPEPEPTTPTPEEQLATLQKELDTATKERDEFKTGLSTAHSKLTKADQEIKKQADVQTRLDGFEETQKILAAMLNEKLTSGEGLEPSEKTDYLSKFDEITKRQKAEREQTQAKSQQEEYNRQCDAIYVRAEEAFKDNEDALFQVRTFLMNGATDLAEKKVAKAEKPTDTKENKVESEEEKVNKLVEEKLRQKMEDAGMLASDTGGPSGAATSERDAYAKYAAGEITTEQARKLGVKFT